MPGTARHGAAVKSGKRCRSPRSQTGRKVVNDVCLSHRTHRLAGIGARQGARHLSPESSTFRFHGGKAATHVAYVMQCANWMPPNSGPTRGQSMAQAERASIPRCDLLKRSTSYPSFVHGARTGVVLSGHCAGVYVGNLPLKALCALVNSLIAWFLNVTQGSKPGKV